MDGLLRSHLFDRDASLLKRAAQAWLLPWKQILKQAKIGIPRYCTLTQTPQCEMGNTILALSPQLLATLRKLNHTRDWIYLL